MKLVRAYYIILHLLFIPQFLSAQYPFSKVIDVEEENLTVKVNTLLKDHYGFIWIGTSEGIFKFNSAIPEKISTNQNDKFNITALSEDATGILWAGCKNGNILTIKNHKISLFTAGSNMPGTTITAIYHDSKKRVWFATAGEGIYCYEGSKMYHISKSDGLSDDNINCLYSVDGKQVLAGTDRGLSYISFESGKKSIYFFTSKNGLPDNIIRCIVATRERNIVLLGFQSKGVLLFNLDANKVADSCIYNWHYGQVNDIIDLKDELIIATEEAGLVGYNKSAKVITGNVLRDSAFPRRASDLLYDNEGNIWAGCEGKLVNFTGDYLRYWSTVSKIPFKNVHTLLADDEGKLWFSPDLRLYSGQQNTFGKQDLRSYDITPPEEHIDITSLYKDRFGCLWIGTMGEGLFRMNIETGKWRRIAENPIAFYGNILNIAGKDDQVWISTLNGVSRFDLKTSNYDISEKISYSNFTKKDGLGSDYVYHILIDNQNRVWFATDGAGVSVYENGMFLNFYSHRLFPSKVAYSLAEDKDHHIWISTYNDGLFEYNEKQFLQYGTKNGLTDLAITSIAVDDYNNIVAVNKKGVDLFNPKMNIVQHFGSESGFIEKQPNLNSITKGLDGRIWIGTENGIVCLNTQSSFSSFAPVATIESISLFNTVIDTALKNTFAYNQNNFSFKLAAAYYKATEKIRFQYWLEGYSKKWETTSDRLINFPQLHPGSYTMKVRASANDNFESSPVDSYSFEIERSFWTTWWFRSLILVTAAVLLYLFFRRRIKNVRKSEYSEREKIQLQYDALKNQVNPHFLFNSFNALMNIVEEDPKEASVLIKHLSQFYRKMTAYSQKELISLEEELELLNSYLFIQQKRYGSALKVSITIEQELKRSTLIPPLVLQLLAENAVKHNTISKESPLHIQISSEQDLLVMRNNINEKLEKEESEGVGLQNIRNRYKFLTSREIAQTQSRKEFIIKIPLIYSG